MTLPANTVKFVIDFHGGALGAMPKRYDVAPVVTLSRGKLIDPHVIPVVGTSVWRAVFDVALDGKEPIDMRCHLRLGDHELSETWLYQYFPTNYVRGPTH
jgi:periplasmic glucans biosynthesis protein